jgi:hypothetical protein
MLLESIQDLLSLLFSRFTVKPQLSTTKPNRQYRVRRSSVTRLEKASTSAQENASKDTLRAHSLASSSSSLSSSSSSTSSSEEVKIPSLPITSLIAQVLSDKQLTENANLRSPLEITAPQLFELLDALEESLTFARAFNADTELRHRLWNSGYMQSEKERRSLCDLYYHESVAIRVSLHVLFKMYQDEASQELPSSSSSSVSSSSSSSSSSSNSSSSRSDDLAPLSETESRLMVLCQDILNEYLGRARRNQQHEADGIMRLSSVICKILDGFTRLHETQFVRHISTFYPIFMELIQFGGEDVRRELRRLLSLRIGRMLFL